MTDKEFILAMVGAIFASGGFWAVINGVVQHFLQKKSKTQKAILGLLHDRIYDICHGMIEKGFVETDEYKNLLALYEPYTDMGGNGTAKQLKEQVDDIPIGKGAKHD